MNDQRMRAAARQRLEQAELAEALDAPLSRLGPAYDPTRRATWIAAAAAAMALSTTMWIASTHRDAEWTQVQDPDEFDAITPEHEQYWPYTHDLHRVRRDEDAEHLPPTGIKLLVGTDLLSRRWLQNLLKSPILAQLHLAASTPDDEKLLDAALSQRMASAPNLEWLMLHGFEDIVVEQLRPLRASNSLRHLCLSFESTGTIDRDVGAALAEIPQLRSLTIIHRRVTPEAIEALANARQLRHLSLRLMTGDLAELGQSLARLPNLRSLQLDDMMAPGWQDFAFLADLNKLQRLELSSLPHGDADLAHLPDGLQALRLDDGTNLTADGVRGLSRLKGLRSLELSVFAPDHVAALAEVVRAAPLQRFTGRGAPSDALWEALLSRAELRVLNIGLSRATPVRDLARLIDLEKLERLIIHCGDKAPEPEALQQLRNLKQLRLVWIDAREFAGRRGKETKEAARLRTCLGPNVEVRL